MENNEILQAFREFEEQVTKLENSMNKLMQQVGEEEEELSEEELLELESLKEELEKAKKQIEENKTEETAILELESLQKEVIDKEKQLKIQEQLLNDLKQDQKPRHKKPNSSSNFLGKFLKALLSNKGKKASWNRKRMPNGSRKQI